MTLVVAQCFLPSLLLIKELLRSTLAHALVALYQLHGLLSRLWCNLHSFIL